MTLDKATEVMARQVLANLTWDVSNQWENFPEIGELDWDFVVTKVGALAPRPPLDEYRAAYKLLTERAMP